MEKEIKKILIIPGKFLEKAPDGRYIIRCLIDKNYTEDRIFDSFSLDGIKNPNLLFIGIMTGVGMMQINFCQADEFEDLFKKKWKILVK
jgi:hypothetical protein